MKTDLSGNGQKMADNSNPPVALDGPGSITLTVASGGVELSVKAGQQLMVDWGDGSAAETYTNVTEQRDDGNQCFYPIRHRYAGSGAYTVQIKGEGLTYFRGCFSSVTTLDVSKCPTLKELDCSYNQLTTLDVGKCTALQTLTCDHNRLTSLDVGKCTALQTLKCENNPLAALDVSKCTALKSLKCRYNQLAALDVSKCAALQTLGCDQNQLTALDVSGCTKLQDLRCGGNPLTALDVSKCPELGMLDCNDNQLTALDVSTCTKLCNLYCDHNPLTALDVSGCPALWGLYCADNRLTSLDVSTCPTLCNLHCNSNQLTALDVSGCTALQEVYCNDNQLTAQALDTVFTALAFSPKRFHIYACDIHIHDNPGSATCDKALAKNNGWRVKKEITIREEAVNNHQPADQKMDKNQVLENIKATQARLVAVIKERYPEVYAIVERIEALDLTPFIDEAAKSLTEAFDWWAKEIEPGSAVGIVHFEYDDTKEMGVLAYGYENAILPEDIGGFVDIDYGATVFGYGSAGFEISGFWDKTAGINEEEETEGENSNYEMAKMAEIFFHAMKKAVLSDNFLKLPKADELTFAIGRHDSSEIIGYVWRKL